MAITPRDTDDAFLREVDEGVRADQLAHYWRRYGIALIAVVVLLLATLGGYLWWRNDQARLSGLAGEDFSQALSKLEVGDAPAALPVFDRLASNGPKGYAALATMTLAGQAITAGDTGKAARLYDQIAADAAAPQPLRDAATVKLVRLRFDELTPADIVKRLGGVTVPGNPWFSVAGEMTALAHLKAGETDRAKPLLIAIVRDPASPPSLRSRAGELAQSIGVDPMMLAPQTAPPAQ